VRSVAVNEMSCAPGVSVIRSIRVPRDMRAAAGDPSASSTVRARPSTVTTTSYSTFPTIPHSTPSTTTFGSVHGPWKVTENGASASPPTVINRYDVSLVISVVIGVNTGATMPPNDFGTTDTVTSDESAAYTTGSRMRNSAVSIATPCFIALDPGAGGAMRPGRPYTTRDLPPTDTESGARRPGPSRRPSRHARTNSDTAAFAAASSRAPGDEQSVSVSVPDSK